MKKKMWKDLKIVRKDYLHYYKTNKGELYGEER